jgi:KipI family sensor histidine kinase inhibitor
LADRAITIEFGESVDDHIHQQVMAYAAALAAAIDVHAPPWFIEYVPTIRSLTVMYDPLRATQQEVCLFLQSVAMADEHAAHHGKTIFIPACYELGADLEAVAKDTGLTEDDVVARHTATAYRAYMLGFLPGFGFLGTLDAKLQLPRRRTPRTQVPAGSVAIANMFTAIYPSESPGGWHLLARTAVPLFVGVWAAAGDSPALIAVGDTVRFVNVSVAAYQEHTAFFKENKHLTQADVFDFLKNYAPQEKQGDHAYGTL